MWNTPSEEVLATIPRLYETENISLKDIPIHLHFFTANSDWYITEYDGEDTFFGFTILGGDYVNAEWGYSSFQELRKINIYGFEIDCEINWKVCKASEVEKIRKTHSWKQREVR